jgi:hypothetical protein
MRALCLLPLAALVAACSEPGLAPPGGGDAASTTDATATFDGTPPADDAALAVDAQAADLALLVECRPPNPVFPTFDRACAVDGDCFIARHQSDCCGSFVAWGLSAREMARFQAAEMVCEGQYPPCGCAPGPTLADDGTSEQLGHAIVVHCTAGACRTTTL